MLFSQKKKKVLLYITVIGMIVTISNYYQVYEAIKSKTIISSWRNVDLVEVKLAFVMTEKTKTIVVPTTKPRKPRLILGWNDLFGKKNWGFSEKPRETFSLQGCPETNCVMTTDRAKLNEADAVLVHMFGNLQEKPPFRLINQRWVFLNHEPPSKLSITDILRWKKDFNWTMTYRWDADIPFQYGYYCKRNPPIVIDYKAILGRKTKLVAWMASNCNDWANRIAYVSELKKYIDIDIYGGCSNLFGQFNKCDSKKLEYRWHSCDTSFDQQYKFYLSFENTLHTDYVTEKFITKLQLNLVPVVRGDGNYSLVGPPQSSIDTKDFRTPKKLAEYLHYLDKNDEEYIKYLKWKENYKVIEGDGNCWQQELGWCLLCKKINDANEPPKTYENVKEWFGNYRRGNDVVV